MFGKKYFFIGLLLLLGVIFYYVIFIISQQWLCNKEEFKVHNRKILGVEATKNWHGTLKTDKNVFFLLKPYFFQEKHRDNAQKHRKRPNFNKKLSITTRLCKNTSGACLSLNATGRKDSVSARACHICHLSNSSQ